MKAAKGSAYEREMCGRLSKWWTNGARDDVFWRSSNSGGRATTRAKAGKGTTAHNGDITYTDIIGKPLIDFITWELKRGYASATIHDVIDKSPTAKQQMFESWFEQVITGAERANTPHWALITRRDRRVAMIFMPYYLARQLQISDNVLDIKCKLNCKFSSGPNRWLSVVGMPLDSFLTMVSPNMVLDAYNDHTHGKGIIDDDVS